MEAIIGILVFLLVATALLAGVFLTVFQPLWGVIDVACSKEHSSGTKAAVILLTLLLLGPIMTFFYACFGTHSLPLKKSSIGAVLALFAAFLGVVGRFLMRILIVDPIQPPGHGPVLLIKSAVGRLHRFFLFSRLSPFPFLF